MKVPPLLTVSVLILGAPLAAQDPAGSERHLPLFASHEPLELTLEADFDALDGDRSQESPERPAVLRWTDASGAEQTQELQVNTRGNFRLRRSTCSFPPLRLNLRKGAVEGTVFDGQDKLKLVTHCRDGDSYEQNVLEEYLAYRIYNLLTEVSFQVRLARITYVDTSGEEDPRVRYAFMIEDEDALATRVGGMALNITQAPPSELDATFSVRMALFQYLVGNTDWSAVYLHNNDVLRLADGRYVAVPYDFDFSGLVDAPYAEPAEQVGTDDVRIRVYRGYCRPGLDYRAVYSEFGLLEERFYDLIRTLEPLDEEARERALGYVEGFYDIIESESRRKVNIEDACLRM